MSEQKKLELLQNQIAHIGSQYHEAASELQAVKAKLAASEALVSKMRKSLSWRITAPLRVLTRLVKRG